MNNIDTKVKIKVMLDIIAAYRPMLHDQIQRAIRASVVLVKEVDVPVLVGLDRLEIMLRELLEDVENE